jgi:ribosomal protein L11 methyltransferase
LIRLAVRVRREHAELVLAELLELAPSGVEEVELDGDVIEYAVFGAPGELPALPAGVALVQIATEEIADDWAERWRSFHRPLVLEPRLTVRPPWEPPGLTPLDVVIDPGQAFGTGAHATTRLCLELMLDCRPAGSFVDLGCGSGVLAIVAAKLGWAPVTGLDYDTAAVHATRENAAANGVEVQARYFDLRSEQVPECSLVAANVLASPLRAWAASQRVLPPELILSGLLATEADSVAGAFAARGLGELDRRTCGEWSALRLGGIGASRFPMAKGRSANLVHAADAASGALTDPLRVACESDPGNLKEVNSCQTHSRSA